MKLDNTILTSSNFAALDDMTTTNSIGDDTNHNDKTANSPTTGANCNGNDATSLSQNHILDNEAVVGLLPLYKDQIGYQTPVTPCSASVGPSTQGISDATTTHNDDQNLIMDNTGDMLSYKDQIRQQQPQPARCVTRINNVQNNNNSDTITNINTNALAFKDQIRQQPVQQKQQELSLADSGDVGVGSHNANNNSNNDILSYKDQMRQQQQQIHHHQQILNGSLLPPLRRPQMQQQQNNRSMSKENTNTSGGTTTPPPTASSSGSSSDYIVTVDNVYSNSYDTSTDDILLDPVNALDAIPVQSTLLVPARILNRNNTTNGNNETNSTVSSNTNAINNNNNIESMDGTNIAVVDAIDGTTITDGSYVKSTKNKDIWKRNGIWLVLSIVLMIIVTVPTAIIVRKRCRTSSIDPSSISSSYPSMAPTQPIIRGKPFTSRIELATAVDDYFFDPKSFDDINVTTNRSSYGPIKYWDVSRIKNFTEIFSEMRNMQVQDTENIDLSLWDVSNATEMRYMFRGAHKLVTDLSRWDVSRVTSFEGMFFDGWTFTSDLSKWNVSSTTSMERMFHNAYKFNSDLSKWDVQNVESMFLMFCEANVFSSDLSRWDIGNVKELSYMFYDAKNFKSDLSKWNTSKVFRLQAFAYLANLFDTDVSNWDTSNVQYFQLAFANTESFRGIGLEEWDVSSGLYFDAMFQGAKLINPNLTKWDTANASTMTYMFDDTPLFEGIGLENWYFSNVSDTQFMFHSTPLFNCNVSLWDMSNNVNLTGMFADTKSFQGMGLETWNVDPDITATENMFCNCTALNRSYLSNWVLNADGSEYCN